MSEPRRVHNEISLVVLRIFILLRLIRQSSQLTHDEVCLQAILIDISERVDNIAMNLTQFV